MFCLKKRKGRSSSMIEKNTEKPRRVQSQQEKRCDINFLMSWRLNYSYRNAMIGSTLVARRAGM